MKRNLFLILSTFMLTVQKAYCEFETISPELKDSLKSSSSDINGFSIVLALIFVILLIYITGIVYQRLNVFGAKTVKEQFKNANLNKIIVLTTTPIGQHRNLHVVELNKKHYLIGSAPNAITLIKELDNVDKKVVKESVKQESENEKEIDDAIKVLYDYSSEETVVTVPEKEEFNIHKKYL